MRWTWLVLLAACGPDGSQGGTTVTGTGVGTAASGTYEVESLTTSCSGKCSVNANGFTISVCDVGDRTDMTLAVRQNDATLRIDSEDSNYISRLEGLIDADGAYDVQGLRTAYGGAISIKVRSLGMIFDAEGNATLTGTATGTVSGSTQGHSLDCRLAVELEGTRTGPLPRAP